jgi:hypothetical protein
LLVSNDLHRIRHLFTGKPLVAPHSDRFNDSTLQRFNVGATPEEAPVLGLIAIGSGCERFGLVLRKRSACARAC